MWKIRYRAENGVKEMTISAPNREDAEFAFFGHLANEDSFGSIIRITPVEEATA